MTDRLDDDEIEALFRRHREQGRRRDRNALVEAHIGFAYHLAARYRDRGVPLDDLRQTALLALVKAVDRYDLDVGVGFTSFAGPTIEGELKRHFRDAAWAVRVPRTTKEMHLAVRSATDELGQRLKRSPTIREVAADLGVEVDAVVEAMSASAAFTPTGLDVSTADESLDRSSRLADIDARLAGADDRVLLEQLLDVLPEREREIVRLRFFEQLTQTEIAERVGISQMHVSRLLRRSFETMRAAAP